MKAPTHTTRLFENTSLALLAIQALFLIGCGGGSVSNSGNGGSGDGGSGGATATVTSVSVTCNQNSLKAGETSQCASTVTGTGNFDSTVKWSVDVGTISSSGLYTAPSSAPASGQASVRATSNGDSTKSGASVLSVTNPQPSITSVTPPSVLVGASDSSVTLNGAGFLPTSVTSLDRNNQLAASGQSSSALTASIPALYLKSPGMHTLSVSNPAPGGGNTPSVGPWAATTGQLTAARVNHAQTLLQDGTVLLTGGGFITGIFFNFLASAETYSPQTQSFHAVGNMSTPRVWHTASLLADGRVLIAGGTSSSPDGNPAAGVVATAEIYDPKSGTFTPTGSMATARYLHTATLLPDGTVLIAGGIGYGFLSGVPLDSAEIYHPATGTFSPAGKMAAPRIAHTATALKNGQVLLAGGESALNGGYDDLNTAELYDPGTAQFKLTGNLATKRDEAISVRLNDGSVLVAGGYQVVSGGVLTSCEIYDPSTGTFSDTAPLGTPRFEHTASLLTNGKVLVAGGTDGTSVVSSAEIYDPVAKKFAPTWQMSTNRLSATATTLADGSVLVAGGEAVSATPLQTAELYPAANYTGPSSALAAVFTVNNPSPVITSLSATTISAGSPVVISGTGFVQASDAVLNGVTAPSYGDPTNLSSFWFYPSEAGNFAVTVNNPPPGGGVSNSVNIRVNVGVQAWPPRALWNPGSVEKFTSAVLGSADTAVTWSIQEGSAGGTINQNGYYTAPSAEGTYHVIAAAKADPTQSAVTSVVIGPGAGQMQPGPAMKTGGYEPIVVLADGKVLSASGLNVGSTPAAEVFDPTTNTFAPTGNPSVARSRFSAALLKDGSVLIAGGEDNATGTVVASAELYDPSSGTFSLTGQMAEPAEDGIASLLPDGRVLIACGSTANPQIYDPQTKRFSFAGKMVTPRLDCSVAQFPNGDVFVAGGWTSSSSAVLSAEVFNVATETFSEKGSMSFESATNPNHNRAALLADGRVLVMDGPFALNSAEIYDPATGKFSFTKYPPAYPNIPPFYQIVSLKNGTVLIAGGAGPSFTGGTYAQIFDPKTEQFFAIPQTEYPDQALPSAALLHDGRVLVTDVSSPTSQSILSFFYIPPATNPIAATVQAAAPLAHSDPGIFRQSRPGTGDRGW